MPSKYTSGWSSCRPPAHRLATIYSAVSYAEATKIKLPPGCICLGWRNTLPKPFQRFLAVSYLGLEADKHSMLTMQFLQAHNFKDRPPSQHMYTTTLSHRIMKLDQQRGEQWEDKNTQLLSSITAGWRISTTPCTVYVVHTYLGKKEKTEGGAD